MLFVWLHLRTQRTLIHPRFPIIKIPIYKIKLYICLKITHDIGVCGHEVLRWRRCCGVGDTGLFVQ